MAEEKKVTIYQKIVQVLEPEIGKLKDFMFFHQKAVKTFCAYVAKIAQMGEDPPSGCAEAFAARVATDVACGVTPTESLELRMILVLDLFALLDELKNMKACLNNDFSFYKRATQFLRQRNKTQADDSGQENHALCVCAKRCSVCSQLLPAARRYLFLANQSSLTASLKEELNKTKKEEKVAVDRVLMSVRRAACARV
jgi:cytoplasmic FMR1 interacting protein